MFIGRGRVNRKTSKVERANSVYGGAQRGGTNPALMLALVPELTPSQVVTIRRSWKHIHTKGLYEVVRKCFQKLESRHSSVKSAFASANCPRISNRLQQHLCPQVFTAICPEAAVHASSQQPCSSSSSPPMVDATAKVRNIMDHTRFMLNLLDRIIENGPDLDLELKRIGARHVPLHAQGFGTAEIERLGEIFAEAFYKLDGIRESKEATKAWRVLIAKIIDLIRDGFETELRLHRRKVSAVANGTEGRSWKRNSMPSARKTSLLKVEQIEQITRKLSNI